MTNSNKSSAPIFGFSSAAGKKIEISKEALLHAKNLFQDEENFVRSPSPAKTTFGFSSAAGKKIEISKEALLHAKKLFVNM